jgi:hypothetical protein
VSRETIAAKADRYLLERRVTVLRVGPDAVDAEARGGDVYRVEWRRESGWLRSCPARKPCCHIAGLKLVTQP